MKNETVKNKIFTRFTDLDAFAAPVGLKRIGKSHHPTLAGACCSVLILIAGLFLAADQMLLKQNYDHLKQQLGASHLEDQFEDSTDSPNSYYSDLRFSVGPVQPQSHSDNNWNVFNVAFGLSDKHDDNSVVEDPLFGQLEAFKQYRTQTGTFEYTKLESEQCSPYILESNFYKASGRFDRDIDFHVPKMKCLSADQNIDIYGDFDTSNSQMLSIFHTSCDHLNIGNCAEDDEVRAWLRHKYVLIIYSQRKLDSKSGGAIEETKMVRIPFDNIVSRHHRFAIDVTHLHSIGSLTNQDISSDFFTIRKIAEQTLVERLPSNYLVELDQHRIGITFEVSQQYNFLVKTPSLGIIQVLSVLGGCIFVLTLFANILFKTYSEYRFEQSLIHSLFKVRPSLLEPEPSLDETEYTKQIFEKAKQNLGARRSLDSIPLYRQLCCCANQRYKRLIRNAKRKIQKETDIQILVQTNRRLNQAIRVLLTPEQLQMCQLQLSKETIADTYKQQQSDADFSNSSGEEVDFKTMIDGLDPDNQTDLRLALGITTSCKYPKDFYRLQSRKQNIYSGVLQSHDGLYQDQPNFTNSKINDYTPGQRHKNNDLEVDQINIQSTNQNNFDSSRELLGPNYKSKNNNNNHDSSNSVDCRTACEYDKQDCIETIVLSDNQYSQKKSKQRQSLIKDENCRFCEKKTSAIKHNSQDRYSQTKSESKTSPKSFKQKSESKMSVKMSNIKRVYQTQSSNSSLSPKLTQSCATNYRQNNNKIRNYGSQKTSAVNQSTINSDGFKLNGRQNTQSLTGRGHLSSNTSSNPFNLASKATCNQVSSRRFEIQPKPNLPSTAPAGVMRTKEFAIERAFNEMREKLRVPSPSLPDVAEISQVSRRSAVIAEAHKNGLVNQSLKSNLRIPSTLLGQNRTRVVDSNVHLHKIECLELSNSSLQDKQREVTQSLD